MKKLSLISRALAASAFVLSLLAPALPGAAATHWVDLSGGDLIKLPDDGNPDTSLDTAIYYFGANGQRYVFPNSKTYFTWYSNFSSVKEVGLTQLGTIGIGGNVSYRPGVKMIKIESDPKVYAVDRGGTRRWVTSEFIANSMYGPQWNRAIDDVPDAFFSNYPEGQPLQNTGDFSPGTVQLANPHIGADKQLAPPIEVSINADGTFSPASVTVSVGRTVRWTNNTAIDYRVGSNPHPQHNALPGFDSANFPPGLNYVYKFKQAGTWGYHHHQNPSHQGTVVVTP